MRQYHCNLEAALGHCRMGRAGFAINAAQHLSVASTDYCTLLFFGNTSGPGSLLTMSCHK
jgi:hypothetical protein